MATMVKEKYREKKKKCKEKVVLSEETTAVPLALENTSSTNALTIKKCPNPTLENALDSEADAGDKLETLDISPQGSSVQEPQQNFERSTETSELTQEVIESETTPSAPPLIAGSCVDTKIPVIAEHQIKTNENVVEKEWKVKFMSLEEVERLFGGVEIAEVRLLSEQEESLIENGSGIRPNHPLIDLLTTFRRSLIAIDRERVELARGYAEEEKFRAGLWKTEMREMNISDKCQCGETVRFRAKYVHATFFKEKVPAGRMKLEILLRDVQQSYSHHQHEALLTHWQIEELIHSIVESNIAHVREALTLILQALRTTDAGSSALSMALQRWARALTVRLLRDGHLPDLLFLLHHLFRQTRSVRWASRLVHLSTSDMSEAARAVTLLDVLLTSLKRTVAEPAVECSEENEEAWEEVDKYGGAGAVSDGAMRERDLLALLLRMPLRNLLARLAAIRRQDIENITEYEWGDASGGHAVLKCACGVRCLLAVLLRGSRRHARYTRLTRALAKLGLYALSGLADLDAHCRIQYAAHLMPMIEAEIEGCALLGWRLLSVTKVRLHRLPFTMFTARTARTICQALTDKLHEPTSVPVVESECDLDCSSRVRVVAQMAIDRIYDFELAAFAIKFLIPLALSRRSPPCKDFCEATARSWMPRLLAFHTHLYQSALHIFADQYKVDSTAVSYIECVSPSGWRPAVQEAISVLDEWSERCPTLLPHMLLTLDCTPFSGLSLETQLAIGEWLCRYATDRTGEPPEWTWKVLRRLRLHRTWWKCCLEVPAPVEEPKDLFSTAHALLATGWGHTIPLICEYGVTALARLVEAGRARDAAHCLARLMLVMTQSPESIAFTPKFGVVRNSLLETGPSLVQRALGLGGTPGAAILTRLLTQQLITTYKELDQRSPRGLLCAWLQLLAPTSELPPTAAPLLEAALVCCRRHPDALQAFSEHLCQLIQDENARCHLRTIARNPAAAPTLCEAILRAEHAERESSNALWPRLLDAVYNQRRASRKIHVDNALKSIIQYKYNADDLVIYRTATTILSMPPAHPALMAMWRFFFYLYLQRAPSFAHETTPPIGSLIFSGVMKSRVLGQLKKRLLETMNHHRVQADSLKQQKNDVQNPPPKKDLPPSEVKNEYKDLFPSLTIDDLTGDSDSEDSSSSEQSDSDVEVSSRSKSLTPSHDSITRNTTTHLVEYHDGIQKALRDYLQWLEEDEKTRVSPHYADLTRYVSQAALDAAWNVELERYTSTLSSNEDDGQQTQRTRFERRDSKTPLQRVLARLTKFRLNTDRSTAAPRLRAPLDGVHLKNSRDVLSLVDQVLKDITQLSNEWAAEVNRVSSLDGALWEYVAGLRERRVFSPVTLFCSKKCMAITLVPPGAEWCKSPGAERGLVENRMSARSALRRLARPRPPAARAVASLQALTRAVREPPVALSALECAWHYARVPHLQHCLPAKDAVTSFVTSLAESWICNDSERCAYLVSKWCNQQLNALQLCLSGALIEPRRLPPSGLSLTYRTILKSQLPPDLIFSRLSKFEVNRWAASASGEQRREVIDAILDAALRFGPETPKEHFMLIELLDVHLHALISGIDLPAHAARCMRSVMAGKWPVALWRHLLRGAEKHGPAMNGDAICGMLRDLGVLWWEARTKGQTDAATRSQHTKHVVYIARLYRTCAKAVVSAMLSAHTTAELAAWYAWSSASEAWGPWSLPHTSPPLLQSTGEQAEMAAHILREFIDTQCEIISACPGGESRLLQEAWLWCCSACVATARLSQAEARVQLHAVCSEILRLPWPQHKWFHARCINPMLQLCTLTDEEKIWASNVLKSVDAAGWLEGVTEANIAPHLAAVLYIVISLPLYEESVQEVMRLPWGRLPLPALDVELRRFFLENLCRTAYHASPCFKVLVIASEMYTSSTSGCESGRDKRLAFITHWVRACASPATPASHVGDAAAAMLDMCNALYGDIEKNGEAVNQQNAEAQEFLCRAIALLDSEPGSSMALPVPFFLRAWMKWCQVAPTHLVESALSAAATLTARETFAALAEALLQAHLTTVSGSWSTVSNRWSACGWHEAAWLAARGRLLAAYGAALTRVQTPKQLQETFLALARIKLDFNEQEPAVALWICRAARAVWEDAKETLGSESGAVAGAVVGGSVVGAAGEALLAAWVEPPPVRVSLMRALSLGSAEDRPTAKLRALCRYAQGVLVGSSDEAAKAVEAALSSALGSKSSEFAPWAKKLQPKMLPALAQRFYPKHRRYFDNELQLAPGVEDVATPT